MTRGRSRAPELLSDLADHASAILNELLEIEPDISEDFGRALAERMAGHWGGQSVYFPQGLTLKLSKRYLQIYQESTGYNHSELAMKYRISLQWIYAILKRVHKEQVALRQRDIFEEPTTPATDPEDD